MRDWLKLAGQEDQEGREIMEGKKETETDGRMDAHRGIQLERQVDIETDKKHTERQTPPKKDK